MCIQGVEGQALNWGAREAEERYGNLLAGCADRAYVHWCPLYGGDRYSQRSRLYEAGPADRTH
jgi:hypothetical protein